MEKFYFVTNGNEHGYVLAKSEYEALIKAKDLFGDDVVVTHSTERV